MAVIRAKKTADYTVMSNVHLRDKRLSLKAKGLLSLILSLPDNWDYSVAGLCGLCVEKTTAIETALAELKRCGYLIVEKKYADETASAKIEYIYNIYERPQNLGVENLGVENLGVENLGVENLGVENLGVENHPLDNNNKSNTNKSNTNILNTNKVKGGASTHTHRFVKPTVEDISAYCAERKNDVDPQRFFDFYEAKGWRIGNNPMKDWKAAVRTWERRHSGGGSSTNIPQKRVSQPTKYDREE